MDSYERVGFLLSVLKSKARLLLKTRSSAAPPGSGNPINKS